MSASNLIPVFVYGTLRSGQVNHYYVSNSIFVGVAKSNEHYCMHANKIPFVSASQRVSQIIGEVYLVSDSQLSVLDSLEGYRPENPDSSWYDRKQIDVVLENGEQMNAYCYFNESRCDLPIIPTGDYLDRDRFQESDDDFWYFAYGSNMDPTQMVDRKAFFTRRMKAFLPCYRFELNKINSREEGTGYANAIYDQTKCRLQNALKGVLYRVKESGIKQLDKYEGHPRHYFKIRETVIAPDAQRYNFSSINTSFVYVCEDVNLLSNGLKWPKGYFEHVNWGSDLHGDIEFNSDKQLIN
jgi:gamma-glutamylcyclotransferase (GGCT)/AIG2-like uncharacterized protein YtfP